MTSELTESELKLADKLITNLQKGGKSWRWLRWFGLVMAIILISLAVYEWWLLHNIMLENTEWQWLLRNKTVSPTDMKVYMDFRLMFLRFEVFLYVGTVVIGMMGGVLLASCLANWRHHRRDLLVAKLLRAEFERRTG